jgi:hypothetical protein
MPGGSLTQLVRSTYNQAGTGIRVNRPAALDALGPTTLFAITGGLVLVTSLVGIVTGIRSAGAGSTMALLFSVGATALTNPGAAITGNATVGTCFTITGDPGDPLLVSVGTGVANTFPTLQGGLKGSAGTGVQMFGLILGVGNIQVTHSAVAGVGATRWILTYIPLDDEASVV